MPKKEKFNEIFDYDKLMLIGIITDLEGYRLAWLMNESFNWDLELMGEIYLKGNLVVLLKNNSESDFNPKLKAKFSLFRYNDEDVKYEVDLIENKVNRGWYIPKLKQFDYLLGLEGESDYLPRQILKRIEEFPQVQTALEITSEEIKKNYLVDKI